MNADQNQPTNDNGPSASGADDLIIEPAAFTRATTAGRASRFRLRPLPLLVATIFAVLLLVAWFMFTARAVNIVMEPVPDGLDISGGVFIYELGDRYLMRPGSYTIHGSRQGYHPLTRRIEVSDQQDQEFRFALEKLPGVLTVTTSAVEPADLIVDQRHIGKTPMTYREIQPGLHDIAIRSERYLPYDSEIDIEGMEQEQSLHAELIPAWGDVSVTTVPPNATVRVDGEIAGSTPLLAEIMHGKHELAIRLPGYKSWQTELEVAANSSYELPPINLVPSDGKLSLHTRPDAANVTISGEYRGQTPLNLILAPGKTYSLSLTRAGYEPVTRSIKIRPDVDIDLNISLDPVLAVVQLAVTPPGAELVVDGEVLGNPNQRLMLSATRHHLVVRKEGYASYDTMITPRPGYDQRLQIELKTVEQARADAIPQSIVTAAGHEMRLVIPDTLDMGAPRREPGRRSNEAERTVTLTRPFYVSTREVTNEEYLKFASSHQSGSVGRALLNQEERPVVTVTWHGAAGYANWLSRKDGLPPAYKASGDGMVAVRPLNTGYRLPTEAEWAWISRYASTAKPSRFPWGESMPPTGQTGNFADISARDLVAYSIKTYDDGYLGTAPVGSFEPNPLGIFDLAGNAAEWVHDIYLANPAVSGEVSIDPTGPERGDYHVIRGSSFMHGRFSELRWTYRDYGNKPRPDVGFRLARYLEQPST